MRLMTTVLINRWSTELTLSLLDIIAADQQYSATIFSRGTAGRSPKWKALRDVCVILFSRNGETLWLEEQEKLGRVKQDDSGLWEATEKWTSAHGGPATTRLEW